MIFLNQAELLLFDFGNHPLLQDKPLEIILLFEAFYKKDKAMFYSQENQHKKTDNHHLGQPEYLLILQETTQYEAKSARQA